MLNLFSKKKNAVTQSDFSLLRTDIHSHLIPGIDDGADSLETSLELIKGLKELGFSSCITTPHVMADLYPNTRETILEGLSGLKAAVEAAGIAMEIDAAAEYFLDEYFEDLLEKGDLLTLPGNQVLVEMSFLSAPPKLEEYIFKLRTKGYKPILAHPERYLFLAADFSKYERLKDMGCLFQLNLLSLAGYYGLPVQKNAEKMLKKGLINLLGTDLHNLLQLEKLKAALREGKFAKLLGEYAFRNGAMG